MAEETKRPKEPRSDDEKAERKRRLKAERRARLAAEAARSGDPTAKAIESRLVSIEAALSKQARVTEELVRKLEAFVSGPGDAGAGRGAKAPAGD